MAAGEIVVAVSCAGAATDVVTVNVFIIPVQMAPEVLFFQQPVQRTGPLIIGRP